MDDVVVLGISSARHTCKVCGKGFPCGRSLGGHMRSHSLAEVAMAEAVADAGADDADAYINGVMESGYGLRENPKKTRRLSSEFDRGGEDECRNHSGEVFSSGKTVSEDVRRHASAGGNFADGEHEDEAGPDVVEPERKLITTEAAVPFPEPRRRRRSMRVPAPAPPPATFDKEPVDVARCLIMLSRHTPSRWATDGCGARNGYYHDAESDDTSAFQYDEVEITNIKKRKPAACLGGDEKRGRYECPGCGRAFQSYQALGGHRASHKRINSSCCTTKVTLYQSEPNVEANTSFSMSSTPASPEAEDGAAAAVAVNARKISSKFECPICFKVFGSGQALGGHKRSHSIAGELYERAGAGKFEPEQPLVAARFLDLNLPAPGAED